MLNPPAIVRALRRAWIVALVVGCTETTTPVATPDAASDLGAPTPDAASDLGAPTPDAAVGDASAVVDVVAADASPPADAAGAAGYRDALRRIRLAACQRAQRCGNAVDPTLNLCLTSAWRFAVEPDAPRLALLLAGIADGSMTFDPAGLDGCLDAIGRSCDRHLALNDVAAPACRNLVHGRAAAGAACRASEECAAGLRCRIADSDAGTGCAGVCAPPAVGERCRDSVCGTLQCDSSGRCVNAPLTAPNAVGNDCGLSVNEPERGYITCRAGQVCVFGVQTNYYCGAPRCDPPCGADAICDYESRRCLDAELLGPGADCSASGSVCDPRRGLRCDGSHRCASYVAEGGACQVGECAAGLECRALVCRRPATGLPAGAACGVDGACASGVCYDRACAAAGCFP
jgi:hypothetical protein